MSQQPVVVKEYVPNFGKVQGAGGISPNPPLLCPKFLKFGTRPLSNVSLIYGH
jgi:hypothetical protein